MSLSSPVICPPGFDCAFANSCPSPFIECPPGFLCSSYADMEEKKEIDYSYALYKSLFGGTGDVVVTPNNARKFIDPDRAIQNACLKGFYCPDATTIKPCPSDHWCPERTAQPQECDGLSVCASEATFQVNFINPLIMSVLMIIFLTLSANLIGIQKRKDTESRKKDPIARSVDSIAVGKSTKDQSSPERVNTEDTDGFFEVSFHDVKCEVPSTSRLILPGVYGTIPAGKISALMGPTASGKSTLMNILRHGKLPNSTAGTVTYSIRSATNAVTSETSGLANTTSETTQFLTKEQAQSYIGHVPQEDILDRNLTVRELFTFHAKSRSRVVRTEEEIQMIVDEVLADLAIQNVADSIIGGGENSAANISGGQLKRVNIGCELVALSKPGLLMLDEPTAGLDAAIAFELVQTLESLKERGITIFMVIQQPRAEIFERIDHLFLMNSAGGIVYEGASKEAVPYLLTLGYTPNNEAFDADYCLDVLNGLRDPSSSASSRISENAADNQVGIALVSIPPANANTEDRLDCTKLHITWRENHPPRALPNQQHQQHHHQQQSLTQVGDIEANSSRIHEVTADRTVPSATMSTYETWQRFIYHSYLNAERLIKVRLRSRTTLLVYLGIDIIMAASLSMAFTIYTNASYLGVFMPPVDKILQGFFPSSLGLYSSHNASSLGFQQLLFFISSSLGSSSSLSAVPVFSGQAVLAHREHAAGVSVWSFAIGRMVGDIIFVLLHACVYSGIWMLFGHAGHFYNWLAVILSTAFAASGIGYITSATYNRSTASTWAIVAAFVSSVFAGVEPSLRQVSRYPVVSWPWYLNFATWTAEATYFTWTRYLMDDGHVPTPLQGGADMYGYKIQGEHGIARSVGAIIALGVAMRVIAAFSMYRRVTKM